MRGKPPTPLQLSAETLQLGTYEASLPKPPGPVPNLCGNLEMLAEVLRSEGTAMPPAERDRLVAIINQLNNKLQR